MANKKQDWPARHIEKLYKKAEKEIEEYLKNKSENKSGINTDGKKYIKCTICGQPKQEKYCSKKDDRQICYSCKRDYNASQMAKKKELKELNDIEKLNKNYNKTLRSYGN